MIRSKIAALGNSRAIFTLTINDQGSRVYSRVLDKYVPPTEEINDPISLLVNSRYSESLRGDKFVKDFEHIEKSVLSDMKTELKRFVVNYGGFKNAKQSGVHRFLNMYELPKEAREGLVYLYKYAKSHGLATGIMPHNAEQKHIDNIMAILELMRSKFEQK